jgi:quinol monooxygenase YgiN
MKAIAAAFAVSLLLPATAASQTIDNYVDYYIVKVKPEKRADFDGLAHKIVDANSRANGDRWIAYEPIYGEAHTIYMASSRKDMAAIDTGMESFMRAMKESIGPHFDGVLREMDSCIVSARGEIRRRRFDLSSGIPDNQEQYGKRLGEARYIRTTTIRIRPGTTTQFEELARTVAKVTMQREPNRMVAVSQAVAGQPGTVYYVTDFQPKLAGFEPNPQSLREVLGDAGYQQLEKRLGETVLTTETMIAKILPELSNPPDAVANVSAAFWKPEPANTADRTGKPKAKK